jgi:hypothetical protein
VEFLAGQLILGSSNTGAGDLSVRGVAKLLNTSTLTNLDTSALLNRENISDATWDELAADHVAAGSMGVRVARTFAIETTAAIGSTPTEIRTGLTQADDFFQDMQVVVVNSAGIAVRNVDAYAQANGAITVSALPFTPAVSDPVIILARTGSVPVDVTAIADAVWDEVVAGHLSAGSFGKLLARVAQLAEPDVVVDRSVPADPQIILKDRTTGEVLVTYNVNGILDTRVTDLDG